jgi:hypothetical protein
VTDARKGAHKLADVLRNCALLDIAVIVDLAHPVNTAEVIVWPEAAKRTLGLVHVHAVGGQRGRVFHKMEAQSWDRVRVDDAGKRARTFRLAPVLVRAPV